MGIFLLYLSSVIPEATPHSLEPYEIVILLLTGCYAVSPIPIYCVRRFLDLRWIKHQPDVKTIDRTVLAENLDNLRTTKGRRTYAKFLLNQKTKLTGQWPGGVRLTGKPIKPEKQRPSNAEDAMSEEIPAIAYDYDDVLDHDLAKLESLELKTYRYLF